MKLDKTEIENYRSIGRLVIDWMAGEVGITSLIAPFGSGKSSVLAAILWAHTGKEPGELADECIRNGTAYVRVKHSFWVGADHYSIVRYRAIGGGRELILYKNGIQPEGDKGYDETQLRINKILGDDVTREVLEATIIGRQGNIGAFISSDPADRRNIFSSMFGLTRYAQYAERAGKLVKAASASAASKQALADSLSEQAVSISALDQQRQLSANALIKARSDEDAAEKQRERAVDLLRLVTEETASASALCKKIDDLRAAYKKVREEIESRALELRAIDLEKKIGSGERAIEQTERKLSISKTELVELEAALEEKRQNLVDNLDLALRVSSIGEEVSRLRERLANERSRVERASRFELDGLRKRLRELEINLANANFGRQQKVAELNKRQERMISDLRSRIASREASVSAPKEELGCDGSAQCVFMRKSNEAQLELPVLRAELSKLCDASDDLARSLNEQLTRESDELRAKKLAAEKELADAVARSERALYDLDIQMLPAISEKEGELEAMGEVASKENLELSVAGAREDVELKAKLVSSIENERSSLAKQLEADKKTLEVFEAWKSGREQRMAEIKAEAEQLGRYPDMAGLSSKKSALEKELLNISGRLSAFKSIRLSAERNVAVLGEKIEAARKAGERLEVVKREIGDSLERAKRFGSLQVWLRKIPFLLIERLLPEVERITNDYLARLTSQRPDGAMAIHFPRPGEPGYASGKRERIDIIADDASGPRRAELLSGGEKDWLAISLRLGMALAAVGRSGASLDFFALDEPFSGLDAEGLIEVPMMLKSLADMGHQVLLISHLEPLQDAAQRKIYLSKSPENGTEIVGGQ